MARIGKKEIKKKIKKNKSQTAKWPQRIGRDALFATNLALINIILLGFIYFWDFGFGILVGMIRQRRIGNEFPQTPSRRRRLKTIRTIEDYRQYLTSIYYSWDFVCFHFIFFHTSAHKSKSKKERKMDLVAAS
jgi:hypothetical protein